jgi:hypothetical protein
MNGFFIIEKTALEMEETWTTTQSNKSIPKPHHLEEAR